MPEGRRTMDGRWIAGYRTRCDHCPGRKGHYSCTWCGWSPMDHNLCNRCDMAYAVLGAQLKGHALGPWVRHGWGHYSATCGGCGVVVVAHLRGERISRIGGMRGRRIGYARERCPVGQPSPYGWLHW